MKFSKADRVRLRAALAAAERARRIAGEVVPPVRNRKNDAAFKKLDAAIDALAGLLAEGPKPSPRWSVGVSFKL